MPKMAGGKRSNASKLFFFNEYPSIFFELFVYGSVYPVVHGHLFERRYVARIVCVES
jgi:hypothetical protein